jgi:uncharacterized protein (DUF362 family)
MNPRKQISRREFLKLIAATGGITLVSPYLSACSEEVSPETFEATTEPTQDISTPTDPVSEPTQGQPTAAATAPSPDQEEDVISDTAKIAFVKTMDRSEGVRKSVDLLGINPVSGKHVFLKPNFNSADPAPGSTHPDVLRSLVTKLQAMGAAAITLGDRSGMGNTRKVMRRIGVFELADELGFETVAFDDLRAEDWIMVHPPDCHWQDGFPVARPCLEAEALVQACCLKTHQYGGHFTMSLKNSVGMVGKLVPGIPHNYMNELHNSLFQREMIAEINLAYTPALIVLDGVYAFIDRGPADGKRVSSGVVLAGTDRVAIDAVGVALLRYFGNKTKVAEGPIFQQDQIARAVELGLGIDGPEKIEFVTGDSESTDFAETIKGVLLEL